MATTQPKSIYYYFYKHAAPTEPIYNALGDTGKTRGKPQRGCLFIVRIDQELRAPWEPRYKNASFLMSKRFTKVW